MTYEFKNILKNFQLQESLRDTQELLQSTINRLQEVEKEKNLLQSSLEKTMPIDFLTLTKEASFMKEQLSEKEEEINELKAERNNTRLLLEHLESLVSRHEKSLRMTVVKRQTQLANNSGVSSEAEVLKALRSLFEHHKALDERYRERYKTAIEKCNSMEEELERVKNELKLEREAKSISNQLIEQMQNCDHDTDKHEPNSLSNSSRNIDLQNILEKQTIELAECRLKLKEYEDNDKLANLNKDLFNSIETNKKLQRDLKDVLTQRDDLEQKVSHLEQQCINLQRECSSLSDLNSRLETELSIRENSLKHSEDRYKNLQSKLESVEIKYEQMVKKNQQGTSFETDIKSLSLAQYQEKHVNIEEKLQAMQNELDDAKMELNRAKQREKMSEEHNNRLTQTVDKLLSESNERLQMHLKERMNSLDEKNVLNQECDKLRKQIDELELDKRKLSAEIDKLKTDIDSMRKDNQNLHIKLKEISLMYSNSIKLNSGLTNTLQHLKKQNAFMTENEVELSSSVYPMTQYVLTGQNTYSPSTFKRNRVNYSMDKEGDWDKLDEAAKVIANVQHAFEITDNDETDDEIYKTTQSNSRVYQARCKQFTNSTTKPNLSPKLVPHTDAQTIAILLQKQLEYIDNEIRYGEIFLISHFIKTKKFYSH